jgi:hypothetical protein
MKIIALPFLCLLATPAFLPAQITSPNTNLNAREQQIVVAAKLPAPFTISHGGQTAQTPPMGWNSYDAYGDSVTEAETLANAAWMQAHLLPVGWDTIVVDFRWYDPQPTGDDRLLNKIRVGAALAADEYGRLLPAPNRFPSATNGTGFKPLADRLHAMGLKFGIHVMRGIPRQAVLANTKILGGQFTAADVGDTNDQCVWCPDMFGVRASAAGQAWYDSCVQLWASWGVDYIKVDDLSAPYHAAEIEMIHRALGQVGRAIVFSTSPGETPVSQAAHIAANANLWRISGDFWDRWPKLNQQFDLLAQWQGAGALGHWPDADMIPLGKIALRSKLGGDPHWTHFTRAEQLSLMSLWALAPSPLMLGMNLPDNDDWTTALLTNPEVLAVNQDPLGKSGVRLSHTNSVEMWSKDLADGSKAVALFNRGELADLDSSFAIYKSPLLTRQSPGPVAIDVPLGGAKKLYLVVDDGGDGYDCDHADWLEPKLITAQGETDLTRLKWKSATSGWQKAFVNQSVSGGVLNVAGTIGTNGIGTHATSVIEYNLPAGCQRFTARAGLDIGGTSQRGAGATVHFLVFTRDPHPVAKTVAASVSFSSLGLAGARPVRDLWLRQELPATEKFTADLPPHGCVLLRVK